ncbi:unnamed protein product [Protopolystoma xenopodis]|uniref:Macoilin n=1 Tax=Protopolystoma xenopodis TaxID=117903 RepID=A0A448XCA1_9PLAT|nr:unnamed protein product [Protopolystoma xenopodis]
MIQPRLENTVRKLRAELQSARAFEMNLRHQVASLEREDRLTRISLSSQRQANEALAAKLQRLVTRTRSDRAHLSGLESQLVEERTSRLRLAHQLAGLAGPGTSAALATCVEVEATDYQKIEEAGAASPEIYKYVFFSCKKL